MRLSQALSIGFFLILAGACTKSEKVTAATSQTTQGSVAKSETQSAGKQADTLSDYALGVDAAYDTALAGLTSSATTLAFQCKNGAFGPIKHHMNDEGTGVVKVGETEHFFKLGELKRAKRVDGNVTSSAYFKGETAVYCLTRKEGTPDAQKTSCAGAPQVSSDFLRVVKTGFYSELPPHELGCTLPKKVAIAAIKKAFSRVQEQPLERIRNFSCEYRQDDSLVSETAEIRSSLDTEQTGAIALITRSGDSNSSQPEPGAPPLEFSKGDFRETKFFFAQGSLFFVFETSGDFDYGETETDDCDPNMWRCPTIPYESEYVRREQRFYFANNTCIRCLEKSGEVSTNENEAGSSEFSKADRYKNTGANAPCPCSNLQANYEYGADAKMYSSSKTNKIHVLGQWLKEKVIAGHFSDISAAFADCPVEEAGHGGGY